MVSHLHRFKESMTGHVAGVSVNDWRLELPTMRTGLVSLRESCAADLGPLVALLSDVDASRFGIGDSLHDGVEALLERVARERAAGSSFTYVIASGTTREIVGLAQVRRIDPAFEAGEWEMTLAPSARGTGAFVDAARLIASFAFESVGASRLESRVIVQNGRANGACRKLGAAQEGVLRRSVRRGEHYLDQALWTVSKQDWDDHWISTASRVH